MYLKVHLKCNSTSVQLRIGETGFAGSNVVIQTVQLDGAKKVKGSWSQNPSHLTHMRQTGIM